MRPPAIPRSLTHRPRPGPRPGLHTGAKDRETRDRLVHNQPKLRRPTMSTTDTSSNSAVQDPETGTVDFRLEVAILPVSDAERAKQFYASLGWREDADFAISEDLRIVQFTPTGSQASIIFGTGVKAAVPASADRLLQAVDDIEAARAELIERGVDVS